MDAPSIFETGYYQRLNDIERRHPWAVGMRLAMDGLLRDYLNGRTDLEVLDAGCGTGFLMQELGARSQVRTVIGLDYSFTALEFCRENGIDHLLQADAGALPFGRETFDLVICIDTLQHLSPAGADQDAVRRFADLLRPGGMVYLRTNSALGHAPLSGVDPDLYRRYLREELEEVVRRAGLNVARSTYLNCIPGIWGWAREYTAARSRTAPELGPGLAIQMPQSRMLAAALGTVLRFEAWLVGTLRLGLPFGHSLAVVGTKDV